MDIDWEIEIGGDAPVIEAQWPGLIDLRMHPQRIDEISELTLMPSLRSFLLALNSASSPVWTSKCDVWEPGPNAIACYIDMLPRELNLFTDWNELKRFCQELLQQFAPKAEYVSLQNLGAGRALPMAEENSEDTTFNLVLRRALDDRKDGFGITAYFAAANTESCSAESTLGALMARFLDLLMETGSPGASEQS